MSTGVIVEEVPMKTVREQFPVGCRIISLIL
jgi:hypothetical protein